MTAYVHVQRLASDILIGFVVITLCSVRATFQLAISSVVVNIFLCDKNLLTKNTISLLLVTTGFLVLFIIQRIVFVCLYIVQPPTCESDEI